MKCQLNASTPLTLNGGAVHPGVEERVVGVQDGHLLLGFWVERSGEGRGEGGRLWRGGTVCAVYGVLQRAAWCSCWRRQLCGSSAPHARKSARAHTHTQTHTRTPNITGGRAHLPHPHVGSGGELDGVVAAVRMVLLGQGVPAAAGAGRGYGWRQGNTRRGSAVCVCLCVCEREIEYVCMHGIEAGVVAAWHGS